MHARARPLPVRAHPLVLGTVLFLSSELMFFAALFAAYFDLRAGAAVWPPPGVRLDLPESAFGTLLLLVASLVAVAASRALERDRVAVARRWLLCAVVAAVSFVVLSLHGYSRETFTMASHAYGSIYYTLTGFHLLHVIAGVGILVAMIAGLRSPALRANRLAGAEAMTYYWHFVFVVWLGVWSAVYLIR